MYASTEKRFDSLDSEDKTTNLTNYVQELDVDRKIVLFAACNKTNNHKVSNKALIAIMDSLPKTTMDTPKKQRTKPVVSLPSGNKKLNVTGYTKARDIFNKGTRFLFGNLLDNPTRNSNDKYNKDIHADGKTASVVYSTDINPNPGTMILSTTNTYKKMEWDNTCNAISICNPERSTNAMYCFQTVANLLKEKLPSKCIETIKNISNPNKFNSPAILDKLRDYNITFTETKQTFEDIFSG